MERMIQESSENMAQMAKAEQGCIDRTYAKENARPEESSTLSGPPGRFV